MKRMTAFLALFVFALMFLVSFLCRPQAGYGKVLNITGQVGLAISLAVFFLLPKPKDPPQKYNKNV